MQHMEEKALVDLRRRERSLLLLAMLLFFISLFALVSRWPVAYPLTAFSCVFYLVFRWFYKKRYRSAYTQALLARILEGAGEILSFQKTQSADGLLVQGGLTPAVAFVPGAKQHHVVHGKIGGTPFSVGEAAFIRKFANNAIESVGGTLLVASDALPKDERWVILCAGALSHFCREEEYEQDGYIRSAPDALGLSDAYTVFEHAGDSIASLPRCAPILKAGNPDDRPLVLAARDGALSLFAVGAFFAPTKADLAKRYDVRTLKRFRFPALKLLKDLLEALPPQNGRAVSL